MPTAYEIYCQWCKDRGVTPPTREWWEWLRSERGKPEPDFDYSPERKHWEEDWSDERG